METNYLDASKMTLENGKKVHVADCAMYEMDI